MRKIFLNTIFLLIFNRPVSWIKNMHIVAWGALLSGKEKMKTYNLLQWIKQSSTLRISPKREKPSPRIVYRYGKQDRQIFNYLKSRTLTKNHQKRKNTPSRFVKLGATTLNYIHRKQSKVRIQISSTLFNFSSVIVNRLWNWTTQGKINSGSILLGA